MIAEQLRNMMLYHIAKYPRNMYNKPSEPYKSGCVSFEIVQLVFEHIAQLVFKHIAQLVSKHIAHYEACMVSMFVLDHIA